MKKNQPPAHQLVFHFNVLQVAVNLPGASLYSSSQERAVPDVPQKSKAAKKNAASEATSSKGGALLTMSEEHIKSGYAAVDKAWAAISGVDTSSKKYDYMKQNSKSFGIVLNK